MYVTMIDHEVTTCCVQHILDVPFIAKKLAGLTLRCANAGCDVQLLFGREGARLDEHLDTCVHALLACPDCGLQTKRVDMPAHRPESTGCPRVLVRCTLCEADVRKSDWRVHETSASHVWMITSKFSRCFEAMRKKKDEVAAIRAEIAAVRVEVAFAKGQCAAITPSIEGKIAASDTRFEGLVAHQRVTMDAQFIEFEVPGWSDVKDTALFNTATPLKAWGLEWWLKIEKPLDGRIGLYLCCGEDELGKTPLPVDVDYQLMVRKRNDDLGVCASVVFRATFGTEKAWGLSKFTNNEAIEREGGYSRTEDKVTFGCRIMPVKGLKWGHVARKPSSLESSHTPPATVAAAAAVR